MRNPFMASTDVDKVSQILNQNSNKNFVQRILKPDLYQHLDIGNGYTATHLMSYDPNESIVYPTIIEQGGTMRQLSADEAYDYAKQTGEFIKFNNPTEAEWFSKNYKSVWGQ